MDVPKRPKSTLRGIWEFRCNLHKAQSVFLHVGLDWAVEIRAVGSSASRS